MLLTIAMRNLWRHKRRTLITSSAISIGLALLMLSSAGTDGMTNNMVELGTGSAAGHVVVQGAGWQAKREVEIAVPSSPEVARQLATALPEAVIVQRVFFEGLLTSPYGAVGVGMTGVQADREPLVNDIGDRIVAGTYLDGSPEGIVLGSTLAETLDVGVGDKVVLMAKGRGELENRLYRVQGIFSFGIDQIDGFSAQVPLSSAQQVLALGTDVHQVSAHLPSARDTWRATKAAKAAITTPEVDVLPWTEALPELADYVASEKAEIYVVYSVIFAMASLGIVNTVLMSVLERMREFGVMLSVGLRPRKLARLVLLEASLLGAFAVTVGVGLGVLANWPLIQSGLDMSALTGGTVEVAGLPLDFVVHFDLDPVKVLIYAVVLWALTVLSAVYPAWQAATLQPVDCLKHV